MYKRFTLALAITLLFSSFATFAAIEDTQIIDKETGAEESALSFQKFSSCENMDTVLTKYFKEALLEQVNLYGNPMPVE